MSKEIEIKERMIAAKSLDEEMKSEMLSFSDSTIVQLFQKSAMRGRHDICSFLFDNKLELVESLMLNSFYEAIINIQLSVALWIFSKLSAVQAHELQQEFCAPGSKFFTYILQCGSVGCLSLFLSPDQLLSDTQEGSVIRSLSQLTQNNHSNMIMFIVPRLSKARLYQFLWSKASTFEPFLIAARKMLFDLCLFWLDYCNDEMTDFSDTLCQQLLQADNYLAIRKSVKKVECFYKLAQFCDDHKEAEMLAACNFEAFSTTVSQGHHQSLKLLLGFADKCGVIPPLQSLILNVSPDHFGIVSRLLLKFSMARNIVIEASPLLIQAIKIKSEDTLALIFEILGHAIEPNSSIRLCNIPDLKLAFAGSIKNGLPDLFIAFFTHFSENRAILNQLLRILPEEFHDLCSRNDLTMVEFILSNDALDLLGIVEYGNYKCLFSAIKFDAFDVAFRLLASPFARNMIEASGYASFMSAVLSNEIRLVVMMLDIIGGNKQQMISEDSFKSFRIACSRGYHEIAQLILQQIAPRRKSSMICSGGDDLFRRVSLHRETSVLLAANSLKYLNFLETHYSLYGPKFLNEFVQNTVDELMRNPERLNEEDMSFYVFYTRSLVRQSSEGFDCLPKLQYLLSMPSIQEYYHSFATLEQLSSLLKIGYTAGANGRATLQELRQLPVFCVMHVLDLCPRYEELLSDVSFDAFVESFQRLDSTRFLQLIGPQVLKMLIGRDMEAMFLFLVDTFSDVDKAQLLYLQQFDLGKVCILQEDVGTKYFEHFNRFASYALTVPAISAVLNQVISSDNYFVFCELCQRGSIDRIAYLFNNLDPSDVASMLEHNSFKGLQIAVRNNMFEVFKVLISRMDEAMKRAAFQDCNVFNCFSEAGRDADSNLDFFLFVFDERLRADPESALSECCATQVGNIFETFVFVAGWGSAEQLEELLRYTNDIPRLLQHDNFAAFRVAAKCGKDKLIGHLFHISKKEEVNSMICAKSYDGLLSAVMNGHHIIVQRLLLHIASCVSLNCPDTVLLCAAQSGNPDVIYYLMNFFKKNHPTRIGQILSMLANSAAKYKKVQILNNIFCQFPVLRETLSIHDKENCLKLVLVDGNFTIKDLQWVLSSSRDKVEVFKNAVSHASLGLNVHLVQELMAFEDVPTLDLSNTLAQVLSTVSRPLSVEFGDILSHIWHSKFIQVHKEGIGHCFVVAAQRGLNAILSFIMSNLAAVDPGLVTSVYFHSDYCAFSECCRAGHLETACLLLEQCHVDIKTKMISAREFCCFQSAVQNGHIEIVKLLLSNIDVELRHRMISARGFRTFATAHVAKRSSLQTLLMQSSYECFAHAEEHVYEYDRIVQPLIESSCRELLENETSFQLLHPNAVFDIHEEEGKMYYFMLRALIRRPSTPNCLDIIQRLLNIPCVLRLVREADIPRQGNELHNLAINLRFSAVVDILVTRGIVSRRAVSRGVVSNDRIDSIRHEEVPAIMSTHGENSMQSLTIGEQKRLAGLYDHYKVAVQQRGVDSLMEEIRNDLTERYHASPATITVNSRTTDLPMGWNEFQQMRNIMSSDRSVALRAYHSHVIHSAWRYLSKPNFWMVPNFPYANRDATNPKLQWSTFNEYSELLVYLFLAAKDEAFQANVSLNIYGPEDRLFLFYKELGLIGRAHNWDCSRRRADGSLEEYDDMCGDKPSCYSGAKRRMFQAVLGHPLLFIVTETTINEELRSFIRSVYQDILASNTLKENKRLRDAWNALIIDGDDGPDIYEALAVLNVSSVQQKKFLVDLSTKYGSKRFTGDLETQVKRYFVVSGALRCHAEKFGGVVGLSTLLENACPITPGGIVCSPSPLIEGSEMK